MTPCERPTPCTLCPQGSTCQLDQERHAIWLLDHRLQRIGRRILVMSNKGGVGKSTVAAALAASLARGGAEVGLLDADLSGPSQPALFGLTHLRLRANDEGVIPPEPAPGLKLISTAFFLQGEDDPVMWRDSYKFEFLVNLVGGTAWGGLDFLIVDMPPGTGGELISLTQILGRIDGAVIVTTPQLVAVLDARKAVSACRDSDIPVLGLVENMSGMVCDHCGSQVHPFRTGGGELAARSLDVPFLGRVPLDPTVMARADEGRMADPDGPATPGARAMQTVADHLAAARAARQRAHPREQSHHPLHLLE